jgi:hypothetical protein
MTEQPAESVPEDFLNGLPERAAITLERRLLHLRAWRYDLKGATGGLVPVYLLDTDLPERHWLGSAVHLFSLPRRQPVAICRRADLR